MSIIEKRLVGDSEIAKLLSVSRSFVRKQRFNRRHGHPHVFDVDPIFIGSVPRYRLQDVWGWIERRTPANNNELRASEGSRDDGRAGQ